DLGISRVHVLARPLRGVPAADRGRQLLSATSDRHGAAPVDIVAGDIRKEGCGIDSAVAGRLRDRITHVIHCAASTDFDLPLAEAAAINTKGALNVAAVADGFTRLRSFVHVSTAYVTPH